jgi:hypothetical protein
MKLRFLIALTSSLAGAVPLAAQAGGCLVRSGQVGPVRVGMTIAKVRLALRGTSFRRIEDADHMTVLQVVRNGVRIMDLYPNDEGNYTEHATLDLIHLYDPACATAEGVHPGLPLTEVEQRFGKLLRLERTEVDSREYAEFEKQPNWMDVQAGFGEAGRYARGKRCAYQYAPDSKVESLWVTLPHKMTRFFLNDSECDEPKR